MIMAAVLSSRQSLWIGIDSSMAFAPNLRGFFRAMMIH